VFFIYLKLLARLSLCFGFCSPQSAWGEWGVCVMWFTNKPVTQHHKQHSPAEKKQELMQIFIFAIYMHCPSDLSPHWSGYLIEIYKFMIVLYAISISN